jgi:hypothetical protein
MGWTEGWKKDPEAGLLEPLMKGTRYRLLKALRWQDKQNKENRNEK